MRNLLTVIGVMLLTAFSFARVPAPAIAQSDIKVERVTFRPGASSTEVNRTIRGRETTDFLVSAREGQRLEVTLTSQNRSAYFNIMAPGVTDVAFYVGSNGDPLNTFVGVVPKTGDLRLRVYLYRAAARRGERANIRLKIAIAGAGGEAVQPSGDALVPGTNYHATGPVDCATHAGGPIVECQQGVIRLGGGSASVTVSKPDGSTRTITYLKGAPLGYDQKLTNPAAMNWSRENGQTTIRIEGETFIIPDAVIFGG